MGFLRRTKEEKEQPVEQPPQQVPQPAPGQPVPLGPPLVPQPSPTTANLGQQPPPPTNFMPLTMSPQDCEDIRQLLGDLKCMAEFLESTLNKYGV